MQLIIAVTLFVISACALPQSEDFEDDSRDERLLSNYIKHNIEEVSQRMKDAGYDPLHVEKHQYNYSLPVPVIFNSVFSVERLLSNGMSNIVVNNVNYSLFSSRLNFDIELPLIDARADAASVETTVFGHKFRMDSSGKVEIQRMRFVGHIRFNINLISGISVRSTKITFTMGGIGSDVNLVVQGEDYSERMNVFLNSTVPATFQTYSSEINELLGILLMDYLNEYFKAQRN